MFESAEQKAEVLAILDRARKAIEDEKLSDLQVIVMEALVLLVRLYAKDVPGALPLVIMESNP